VAVDTFFKMLDTSSGRMDSNEAAAVLQPIARWLGDFVDKVYERGS